MRGPIAGLPRHIASALLGAFLTVGALIVFLQLSGSFPSGGRYTVQAALPTSAALVDGSRVTMAGAQVGTVKKIERRGIATVVTLELEDERVTPIPEDTKVTLRQRTPVGESYIALTPGRSAQKLDDGAALPISQAEEYVDIDQLLSTLQGPTRDKTRQLIQGVGDGVRGRGDELNEVLGHGSSLLKSSSNVYTLLSQDREQLARLVGQLGRLGAAVGERGEAVRVTAQRGLTTLRAVRSSDAALRRLVDELPATLEQVRASSNRLDSVSDSATPVVANLAKAVAEVRPAVRSLRPAAQTGREVVRELDAVAPPLQGTLKRVTAASSPLGKALPALNKTLCEIAPMVRYVKPYTDDVLAAVVGLGSATNSYDALGHLVRLDAIVSENTVGGLPDEVQAAQQTLLRSGLVGELTGSKLTYNPFPKPGQIGQDYAGKPGTPIISGPEDLARSGYKYPRLTPDC